MRILTPDDLRWSWGSDASAGEQLQIQIIISREVWWVYLCWQDNTCFCVRFFQEDMQVNGLCAPLLPINIRVAELFKPLNVHISGTLNWPFCVCICSDGAAAMTECLLGFTTHVKEVASECESPHCGEISFRKAAPTGSTFQWHRMGYKTCLLLWHIQPAQLTQSITSGKNDNCAQVGRWSDCIKAKLELWGRWVNIGTFDLSNSSRDFERD